MASKKKNSTIALSLNKNIQPLTKNQELTFSEYPTKNLILEGYAGTGKTFVSLYLALDEVLSGRSVYDNVIIIRSVVASRDMGFLPGSMKEKVEVYEAPYESICAKLFERGDAYQALKNRGTIQFTTTSFLRGLTFENSIVIVDEMQNMSFHELDTIMTRLGDNSKILFCGDFLQTDLANEVEKKGLKRFIDIVSEMRSFSTIIFRREDIVRSGIVKEYIIEKTEKNRNDNWTDGSIK